MTRSRAWRAVRLLAVTCSVDNAAAARAPALIVISSRDEVVPFAFQREVADAYGGPHQTMVSDGGHNDFDATTIQPALRQLVTKIRGGG